LDDPTDLARVEAAAALRREIPVVPVLVGGAAMPSASDLPRDLEDLMRRHAHEISDQRWDHDQNILMTFLQNKDYVKGAKRTHKKIIHVGLAFLVILFLGSGVYFLGQPHIGYFDASSNNTGREKLYIVEEVNDHLTMLIMMVLL
jgi:hypothetical protein